MVRIYVAVQVSLGCFSVSADKQPSGPLALYLSSVWRECASMAKDTMWHSHSHLLAADQLNKYGEQSCASSKIQHKNSFANAEQAALGSSVLLF